MNQQLLMMLPGLQPDELITIQNLTRDFSEEQQRHFISFYQGRRKDPQTLLLLAAIGFLGFAGIHRFAINQVGMGILFLLTLGFCGIGTIIDMVNARALAADYNQQQAVETANMVRMMHSR
jgi:TM2 domain-containing membrane protein YozV